MYESNFSRSRILKLLVHGTLVGLPLLLYNLLGPFFSSDFFSWESFWLNLLLGPIVIGSISYALLFIATGGINLALVEYLWRVRVDQNIAVGIRDGFFLVLIISIAILPLNLLMDELVRIGYFAPNLVQILLVLVVTLPVYSFLFGVIGEKLTSFLHSEVD